MLLTCTCGKTNRLPSIPKGKIRCGGCRHVFQPAELARCRPEDPPARPEPEDFELERELDELDDFDEFDTEDQP